MSVRSPILAVAELGGVDCRMELRSELMPFGTQKLKNHLVNGDGASQLTR